MVNIQKEIKNNKVFARWKNIELEWKTVLEDVDAILIKDGIEDDESIKIKTLAIQSWFFKFEFINSIMILTKESLIIFANAEMIKILSFLENEAPEFGKKIVLITKGKKTNDEEIKTLFDEIKKTGAKKFGIFKREIQKGSMMKMFEEEFQKNKDFQEIDISNKIQEFLSVKNDIDLSYQEKSAKATCYFFEQFVNLVENIIEKDLHTAHSEISKQMEEILNKEKNTISKKFDMIPNFFDFSYAPLIQSSKYDLRINAEVDEEPLKYGIILLNLAGKYFELNCNVFRTLLINPSPIVQKSYLALYNLHNMLISNLKENSVLNDVYSDTKKEFLKKYSHFEHNLPKNFGFGIGYEFRETCLTIREKNFQKIKRGQVFSIISSLDKIKDENGKEFSIHLSDTVILDLNGKVKNLTQGISSDFSTIGYNIDDDKNKTEQYKNAEKEGVVQKEDNIGTTGRRTRAAIRREEMMQEQNRALEIKKHQRSLLDKKMAEMTERLKSGNFTNKSSESKKIVLEKMKTYKNGVPDLNKDEIHIDKSHSTVLLPISHKLVPFHISCIKNVTKHQENKFMSIRFNFHTPSMSSGMLVFPTTTSFGSDPVYIKELSFKSTNTENITLITKQIKEMQKNFKLNLDLNQNSMTNMEKEVLKDKLKTLNDLKMRPTLKARKTTGSLTAFSNGFKFITNKNENFVLMLSNIDVAIFQPCDENMVVILHFYLKNPIVINKKLTKHVQFYTEVGVSTEDLNDPRKKNRGYDDYDEEELENQAKEHYNKLFMEFVKYVQSHWESDLQFDSPYEELGFFGSPFYNNVFIMPSAYTLMAVVEKPFLVIKLDEIELVSIERIDNKIKNFDMVIVFKDYTIPVQTISNIPKSNLSAIKEWMNKNDILFFEGGTINMKWDKFLKRIREDPETFINEEGGWYAFVDDSEDEDAESGEHHDSSFEVEAEDEEEDDDLDEDDFYNEEDESDEEEEYDDDEYEEEEEEEEYSDDDDKPKKKKNDQKNKKRFK
jgi:nucleosome binding factor SPN SPT16 subunit